MKGMTFLLLCSFLFSFLFFSFLFFFFFFFQKSTTKHWTEERVDWPTFVLFMNRISLFPSLSFPRAAIHSLPPGMPLRHDKREDCRQMWSHAVNDKKKKKKKKKRSSVIDPNLLFETHPKSISTQRRPEERHELKHTDIQPGAVKLVLWRHWMHLNFMHPVMSENQFHCTRRYTGKPTQPHKHTPVREHGTHTHTHTHAHTHTCMHKRMHTLIHTCTNACTHSYTHAQTHAHTHTRMHTHRRAHTHTHTHTHTHARARAHARYTNTHQCESMADSKTGGEDVH